jgi:DNA-binding transcriptional regulator YiaG
MPYQSKVRFEGHVYTVDIPDLNIPRCQSCGELLFDNRADDQMDLAFRKQAYLLTPEQILANRVALGLTRGQLALRLGVEEDQLRRWEEDEEIQGRAMDNLLRVYFAIPPVRSA